jgi:mannitol-specific phosphotransferase system IIBC component
MTATQALTFFSFGIVVGAGAFAIIAMVYLRNRDYVKKHDDLILENIVLTVYASKINEKTSEEDRDQALQETKEEMKLITDSEVALTLKREPFIQFRVSSDEKYTINSESNDERE